MLRSHTVWLDFLVRAACAHACWQPQGAARSEQQARSLARRYRRPSQATAMTTSVLLRGLMREQRHWGDFPRCFNQALPQAVVVTPDLPGNDSLWHLTSTNRVADIVAFCRSDLRARALAPPHHVLALSMGAMAALEWSARYPDEVVCAVLINTSMRPFSRFYQRLRWRNYRAILTSMLRGGTERQERLILRLTSNGLHVHARLLES